MSCIQAFDGMCRKIVCPTRHDLNQHQMIQRRFRSANRNYQHFNVKNKSDIILSGIVFFATHTSTINIKNAPTILYLHGNGGHKLQCLQIVHSFPSKINLFAFDFQGCGKSQGEFVTYGEKQIQDIKCVFQLIKSKYQVGQISIWGRSMGASLAIMYTAKYPAHILCLILDTPFRSLKKVVLNVAQHNRKSIPGFILSFAVFLVQKKTQDISGVDVFSNDFLPFLSKINIPIMFSYSTEDTVVKQGDVRQLYNQYHGLKEVFKIDSLHHQDRPKKMIQQAIKFIESSIQQIKPKMVSSKHIINQTTQFQMSLVKQTKKGLTVNKSQKFPISQIYTGLNSSYQSNNSLFKRQSSII